MGKSFKGGRRKRDRSGGYREYLPVGTLQWLMIMAKEI